MMAHQFALTDKGDGSGQDGESGGAGEIKFLGIVKSYNEQKAFGMIECNEAGVMWQQDIYVYKDVLVSAGAGVGDTVRFGIHISPKGQPQASLPLYKIGDDGEIEGEVKEKDRERLPYWQHVEDMGLNSQADYERIKNLVEQRSAVQNAKSGGGARTAQKRAATPYGWAQPEVSLYVSGVPPDVSRREISHIFRQYQGYLSLRTVPKEDHTLTFVSFASHEEAEYAAMSLNGYVFDEETPAEHQAPLVLHVAKGKGKGGGKDYGKDKGKSYGWEPYGKGAGGGGYAGGGGGGGGWMNGYGKGGSGMLQQGAPIGYGKGKGMEYAA